MGGLTLGGLGTSFSGAPVTEFLWSALPMTLLIFATGAVLAFLLGDWLGRLVAWHRGRLLSGTVSTISLLLYTAFPPWLVFLLVYFGTAPLLDFRSALGMPIDSQPLWRNAGMSEADVIRVAGVGLFLALILALVVRAWARRRGWRLAAALTVPAAIVGMTLAMPILGVGDLALDVLLFRSERRFSIGYGSPLLAVIAFVLLAFGEIMFVVRTGVATEMDEDYVLTARAKGLAPRAILDRHVARNAVLPVLSRSFSGVPYVLSGLIVIEREFGIAGLSSVFFTAVGQVDTPLILGILVAIGVLSLILRLILDILHATLDPRIKLEHQT
jgi:peptide/nickel transport system permease protein